MGMDPITLGILGASGFQAYQQYKAGGEAQEAYDEQAAEILRQNAYQQRMALEEMKEVGREGRAAESEAIAAAGKSGLRVGGSVMTLAQSIQQKVERRKALIGFQSGEETRRALYEGHRYGTMGRKAKKAAGYQAINSLLVGGLGAWDYQRQLGGSKYPAFKGSKATAEVKYGFSRSTYPAFAGSKATAGIKYR